MKLALLTGYLVRFASLTLLAAVAAPITHAATAFPGVADTRFVQEYRESLAFPTPAPGPVRSIAVATDGSLWLAAKAGVFRHDQSGWIQRSEGSCYSLAIVGDQVWAGCWDSLRQISTSREDRVSQIQGPVIALWSNGTEAIALTPTALHEWNGSAWTSQPWTGSRAIRGVVRDPQGTIWVATSMGVWFRRNGEWHQLHEESEILSGEMRTVALDVQGNVWLGSISGVDVYRDGKRSAWFNVTNGLANQNVHSLLAGPGGALWIGTELGVMRKTQQGWSLRHSRRWLADDHVAAMAAGKDGTVWVATQTGISAIRRREMTLEEKADHYLRICLRRHVRTPYLVEQCDLESAGDTEHFKPRDDDNDGQYTSMYLQMESYRYAVTHDPQAQENARRAFHALKFLQEITATNGFFARTVVPSSWTKVHDPNQTFSPEERTDRTVENPRFKAVENRWRRSPQGRWLWKGDTSSDEVTGHFSAYWTYYQLAADEDEKTLVRDHVRRVMDYIVDGGYTFRDIDGQPTLWGNWSPEALNRNPEWRAERWTNALEILSYLRTAELITGDAKYRKHAQELLHTHHYDQYARRPMATASSERTHFDHELVALTLPALVTETDPATHALYEQALAFWLPLIRGQKSPYYSFTWALLAKPNSGEPFDLNGCVEMLRDEPLDLVQWTVDNRQRMDVRFTHEPMPDALQVDRLLPPSERGTMRWDGNPYEAVRGEDGMSESSGVFWLLPYWMGRYAGLIQAPTR